MGDGISGDILLSAPDQTRRDQLMLNGALLIRPTQWECRLRSVRWHVMNGYKVGNYGDFHMLSSIVKYDRTHPVQLTASNLALAH